MKFLIFCLGILGFSALVGAEEPGEGCVFTLEESIQWARENNPQVLLAREGLAGAAAGVIEARSAALPRLSAQAAYTRLDRLGLDSQRANLELSQLLYAGGGVRAAMRKAKLYHQVRGEALRTVEAEITFLVKKSFYGVLLAQELVVVRAEALNLLQSHYQATGKRFEEGEVPKFDLLRARVEVTNASSQLVKAKSELQSVKNSFRRLLDLDLGHPFSLEGTLEYLPFRPGLDEALLKAREQRPEIGQLKLATQMGEEGINIARSGHRPAIFLFGNYEGLEGLPPTPDWDWAWNVGIKVEVPLFDGLKTRGRVRQALSEYEKAQLQLRDLEDRVKLEVRQACLDLEKARQVIRFQSQNVQLAEENLNIVRERYREGISTHLEVMDVHLALTEARTGYARAIHKHLVSEASFQRAIGGQE